MESSSPQSNNMDYSPELQALIAAIPHELSLASGTTSKCSSSSIGDLSLASSSSLFPGLGEMSAFHNLSIPVLPTFINQLQFIPTMPFGFAASLPPHATLESLSLINSHLYQQHLEQRAAQSAIHSPASPTSSTSHNNRPRAFSSAATLQHVRPDCGERRRKRTRKTAYSPTTETIKTPENYSAYSAAQPTPITNTMSTSSSLLRLLVEEVDETPNKVRPIVVTQEEEELVRKKTVELLEKLPVIVDDDNNNQDGERRPLRQLIRDQDLPDEVGPDSPFRHYPKYQQKNHGQAVKRSWKDSTLATSCIDAFNSQFYNSVKPATTLRELLVDSC